jgi:hypothetical protein
VGPRAVLDAVMKRKIPSTCRDTSKDPQKVPLKITGLRTEIRTRELRKERILT